ncbi:hypothetical protein QKW60_08815 [Defluviimonas aestuarii]|uniref:hypothetical protein n=1 Tax=Albidovulum aestuarii TaxID=1130726 RepID=UPI00249A88CD|nr:hypothetical protein [Defluviimonas aestuarii]MDI3336505.1 hypothetical protein [Defluviimonas aestuarii]
MVDRNLQNFYGRIGRIEKIHKAGGGFEAQGTLGMSYYNAQRRSAHRRGFLAPLVLTLMTIVLIKSMIHASIGAAAYDERIVTLQAGEYADRVGAYVLQADPLTIAISDRIRAFLF